MKKILISLIVFVSVGAFGQTKKETALKTTLESFRAALLSGDRGSLSALAADQLSYGHSSGKIENKAQFVEALASGESDFTAIQISNETISFSKDLAIVRHRLDATTNNKGLAGTAKIDILLVWQYLKGKWQLVARQAVKVV